MEYLTVGPYCCLLSLDTRLLPEVLYYDLDKKIFSVKFKLQKDDKIVKKSFPQETLRFTQGGHYEYLYL